ncbi:hypothetical protein Acr_11g0011620 [Actinidia rufa]|uniref:Uncharacterized protein n=1 Tax=Actinidia rufa TaxID=165716 RepID=A0A7J0FEK3_9ERIC|nr:hypothetical protein Acr_11g0011620 [Actinidia rufa]
MELNQTQLLVHNDVALNKERGLDSSLDLDDPSGWASVSHKPNAEGGDGVQLPYLYAGISEFCLDCVYGGYIDASVGAFLQGLGSIARIHRSESEGAGHPIPSRHNGRISDSKLPFSTSVEEYKVAIQVLNNRWVPRKVANLLKYELILRIARRKGRKLRGGGGPLTLLVSEDVITHSYLEGEGSDTSSGEVGMAPKFRILGQKKSKSAADPPAMSDPSINHDPKPTPDPILALNALGEVTVANSSKNHDSNLALAQAIMLPKDVAMALWATAKEGGEEALTEEGTESRREVVAEEVRGDAAQDTPPEP